MIKFHSSFHLPQTKFARLWNFLFLIFFLALISGGFFVVYFVLMFFFSKSILLGLLFVFFGLPLLVRILFFLFFGIVSSLFSALFFGAAKEDRAPQAKDDVIDVKYKIVDK